MHETIGRSRLLRQGTRVERCSAPGGNAPVAHKTTRWGIFYFRAAFFRLSLRAQLKNELTLFIGFSSLSFRA